MQYWFAFLMLNFIYVYSYYPFDRHKCTIAFQSWLYDLSLMNLTFEDEEDNSLLQQYRENNQFRLIKTLLQNNIDESDGLNWTIARFSMVMSRRPLYHLFNLVFPCALISLITCLVFLGPPESMDKVFGFRYIFECMYTVLYKCGIVSSYKLIVIIIL